MIVSFYLEKHKFPLLMPRSQSQSPKRLGHFKLEEIRAEYFARKLGPLAKSPQASSDDAVHGDASYPFGSAVNAMMCVLFGIIVRAMVTEAAQQ